MHGAHNQRPTSGLLSFDAVVSGEAVELSRIRCGTRALLILDYRGEIFVCIAAVDASGAVERFGSTFRAPLADLGATIARAQKKIAERPE